MPPSRRRLIESLVERPQAPIDFAEIGKARLVQSRVRALRLEGLPITRLARGTVEVEQSESDETDVGCAERVGLQRLGQLADGQAEYVGEDLTPHTRAATAAQDGQLRHRAAEKALDRLHHPARVERHPFENGANDGGA